MSIPKRATSVAPDVLAQVVFRQARRKTELAADRLADPTAVEGARHRVDDGVGDRAVELVPLVERGDKIVPLAHHRSKQQFDPLRRDAAQIGVDNGAGARAEVPGTLDDGADGAALAGNAMVGGADAVNRVQRMAQQQRATFGPRASDHVRRPVFGTAIGVDDDRRRLREILRQTIIHGCDNVPDSVGTVVAGDPDYDVGVVSVSHGGSLPPVAQ